MSESIGLFFFGAAEGARHGRRPLRVLVLMTVVDGGSG
jgi:hypothetical protein